MRSPRSDSALDQPWVRNLIESARVAHLATASAAGRPHNVPICFCFDAGRFYFAVDEKPKHRGTRGLKRIRNIAENPYVCLIIDHYEEDWGRLGYLMIHGSAGIVEHPGEWRRAVEALRRKYPQYRRMTLRVDRNPVVRIDPESFHLWAAAGKAGPPG